MLVTGCATSDTDDILQPSDSGIAGLANVKIEATFAEETRTAFGDRNAQTNSYPVMWVKGDEIAVVEHIDGTYSQHISAAASLPDDSGRTATFEGNFAAKTGKRFDYYACYPASAYSRSGSGGIVTLPDAQTPRVSSVDPSSMLLEGTPAEGFTAQAQTLGFAFSHITAYAKMTVGKLPAGTREKVQQIEFISGDIKNTNYVLDGAGSASASSRFGSDGWHVLKLDVSGLNCYTDAAFDVWFSIMPAAIDSFTVVVKTADANYTKTFSSNNAGRKLSFESGAVSTFTVEMSGCRVDDMGYNYSTAGEAGWPRNDEKQVYSRPYEVFTEYTMPKGAPHPNKELAAKGWKLYTVNEFSSGKPGVRADGKTTLLPFGLYPHNTAVMNESAIVRNEECGRVEDGRLIMEAHRLPAAVSTGFKSNYSKDGMVEYEHAAFRTYPSRNKNMGDWFSMAPNMRFEVRCRRTNTQGFNNAVWFQGNILGSSWPTYGEIDVVENPKPNANNQTLYQTLHFGPNNNSPGWSGPMNDLTRWHIFWLEIYPDKIVMGANGKDLFSRDRNGANTLETWPWSQEDGFYLILSTGMYDNNHSTRNSWAGSVRPADFTNPDNLPTMEFDWIRVYVNDDYDREEPMGIYY